MYRVIFMLFVFVLSSCSVLAYTDVDDSQVYGDAIQYITDNGIVGGYPDGTFKPGERINRAEFTKILVEAKLGEEPAPPDVPCFNDFDVDQWYASYVCYAKDEGIIEGYPDGSFGGGYFINLAEASKILVNTMDVPKVEPSDDVWFTVYLESLTVQNYIPSSFDHWVDEVMRYEMAEMIWRIMEEVHDADAVTAGALLPQDCLMNIEDLPDTIDMDKVREAWLEWYNEERRALGLHEYIYNSELNRSATIWSEVSKERGYIDHKRDGMTSYYDYDVLVEWFKNINIEFEDGAFSENIAWEYYSCDASESDCTDEMIAAVQKGFNFFIGEKGTDYTAHYDSMIHPTFKEIGLGIALDQATGKYYLTVHYAKGVTSALSVGCF